MKEFTFDTKGLTLKKLVGRLGIFEIPDFEIFSVTDIQEKGLNSVTTEIQRRFKCNKIVVRSSSVGEDGSEYSGAGQFESVLNIEVSSSNEIRDAIGKVINSYDCNSSGNQIIVQEFISNISMSGVVFTRDINTGAPYFVVNYDDVTGLTNSVTAGDGMHSNRIIYIRHHNFKNIKSTRFQILISAIEELMGEVCCDKLDIEFALTTDLKPVLFQVRPITMSAKWHPSIDECLNRQLSELKNFISSITNIPTENKSNDLTFAFSQMTDWNPAEIIGNTPRRLAFSLYREFITNKVWSNARRSLGYSLPADDDLIKDFSGHPFVNVRASFQSFLPESLTIEIKEKLVDHFINRLILNPELHDKVEFDIVPTVYTMNLEEDLEVQIGSVLSPEELVSFKSSLRELTQSMINGPSSINKYLSIVDELNVHEAEGDKFSPAKLHKMIEDCKIGTFAFSALARHGFVAVSILNSLVSIKILSEERIKEFYEGFSTIASDFVADSDLLSKGAIDDVVFFQKYGHLRPGTYDILLPRYDEMDISLFKSEQNQSRSRQEKRFSLSQDEVKAIDASISAIGLIGITPSGLITYCMEAIKSREYSKFIFTKFVSAIIKQIILYGKDIGFSRDQLSYLDFGSILGSISGDISLDGLREEVKRNADRYKIATSIKLPPVLCSPNEVDVVPFQVSLPNYIGGEKIMAPVIKLVSKTLSNLEVGVLENKIILIENADPGFDWLFSFKIGGLITRYGGANSHMAIRCAEFGIPAAIGCGDYYFYRLSQSSVISLDCSAKKIGFIN